MAPAYHFLIIERSLQVLQPREITLADMDTSAHLMIVEDDPFLSNVIAAHMKASGYRVSQVDTAESFRRMLTSERFDLILLDLNLPDEDGFSLAKQVLRDSGIPIIMVTGRGESWDRIAGLELGADDYVVKPFEPRELVARVRNVLRRSQRSAEEKSDEQVRFRFNGMELDLAGRSLSNSDGNEIRLTPAEFNLLTALVRNPGKVLTRDYLVSSVAEESEPLSNRAIDVLISRVRKKVEPNPKHPELIVTVSGFGYKFAIPVE